MGPRALSYSSFAYWTVVDFFGADGKQFIAAAGAATDPSRITFSGIAIDAPSASFAGSTDTGMTATPDGGPAITGGAIAGHF